MEESSQNQILLLSGKIKHQISIQICRTGMITQCMQKLKTARAGDSNLESLGWRRCSFPFYFREFFFFSTKLKKKENMPVTT